MKYLSENWNVEFPEKEDQLNRIHKMQVPKARPIEPDEDENDDEEEDQESYTHRIKKSMGLTGI